MRRSVAAVMVFQKNLQIEMGKRMKTTQTIKHLPQDMIDEILFNSPVKSLLRFKSVSKQWRCLISSKYLTKEHLKKSSDLLSRHNLIYSGSARRVGSCSVKSFLDEQNYDECCTVTTSYRDDCPFKRGNGSGWVGSCNGLILLIIKSHDFIFWNPSTRQERITPGPPRINNHDSFIYGFGYDDTTDDYKAVSILFPSSGPPYKTHMYSLRNSSWKEIGSFENGYPNGWRYSGTFMNGKLHWLAAERDNGRGD